jgi:DNA-binding response OmpR family regulator
MMVIDEDPEIRVFLFNLFRSEGFQVVTFENPFEALKQVQAVQPDLVVLDFSMPQIDGIDFLELLRMAAPATPVLMLTAHGNPDLYLEAFQKGAVDMIVKPASASALVSAVDKILKRVAI